VEKQVLMWENAEVPTEVMADTIQELERRGFITTPQTKPLSDDEIIAIRDSCYVQSGIDEWEFDDVVFARKIEERLK